MRWMSWTYNFGPGRLKKESKCSWLKKLNQRQYAEVPQELKKWNKYNKKESAGLVKRRNEEAELFSSDFGIYE